MLDKISLRETLKSTAAITSLPLKLITVVNHHNWVKLYQKTSVQTGDFLQKNVKCMLVEFCRAVTLSPYVRVKGHLCDNSQLLLYYTWLCLFVKWRQKLPTFCKGLNISRMQAFVRLPTEFDNLLLNAVVRPFCLRLAPHTTYMNNSGPCRS